MIPTISEITKPLLELVSKKGSLTMREAEIVLGRQFHLTDDEIDLLKPSGGERMFLHRIRWARTYLKKAKLVKDTKRRGQIMILDKGLKLVKSKNCPDKITESYLNKYKSFKETRRNLK